MKAPATDQKLRGGYYTPAQIARFLADWAITTSTETVLEPSCGDGNILAAAAEVLLERGMKPADIAQAVSGIEIDKVEASKATTRLSCLGIPASSSIRVGDFFAYCEDHLLSGERFDAAIGNPPFIRYQSFLEVQRAIAFRLMKHAGMRPTRLMNAWVPFVVATTLLLNPHGGRLAMVVPAELMQVSYTAELRRFLVDSYSRITLITFRKLVFSDIQQEVVLLLGERDGKEHAGIRTIELTDLNDLNGFEHQEFAASQLKEMDHSSEKWTQYYLDACELDLLRSLRTHPSLTPAQKVLGVDVGIVTGLNDFFVMSEEKAKAHNLLEYTIPIVTRSAHLPGIQFRQEDLIANTAKQLPARLLTLPDVQRDQLPDAARNYILMGERLGSHQGYKCRIRKNWYVVPSIWVPDAFMLRQIHGFPKLILNLTEATSTDTIHRVRFDSKPLGQMIVAAFHNSLTFASTEVMGRSYGGGVLELEPNEADGLPLPLLNADRLDIAYLSTLALSGDIEAILDITDRILLVEGLGLSKQDVVRLRMVWHKLRNRRINRNHNTNEK